MLPSQLPSLKSSTTNSPETDPDPNEMSDFKPVLFPVLLLEKSYENSLGALFGKTVSLPKNHAFVDPVSNRALNFYGGFPTKTSET